MKIQERKHGIQLVVLSFLSINKEENIKSKTKRKRWYDIESLFTYINKEENTKPKPKANIKYKVHEFEEANNYGTRLGIWAIFYFDDINLLLYSPSTILLM